MPNDERILRDALDRYLGSNTRPVDIQFPRNLNLNTTFRTWESIPSFVSNLMVSSDVRIGSTAPPRVFDRTLILKWAAGFNGGETVDNRKYTFSQSGIRADFYWKDIVLLRRSMLLRCSYYVDLMQHHTSRKREGMLFCKL